LLKVRKQLMVHEKQLATTSSLDVMLEQHFQVPFERLSLVCGRQRENLHVR